MLMQCEDGSSCVNIWKQFLWKQAEEKKKISWTAQITYNSAIQVVNSDQIKYLPPKLNWNSGFYSSQYMLESSKCGSKLKYLPAACHPLPSIFMTQSNLKRAQADICVGNKKKDINIFALLFCVVVSKGGQKGCDRHCREILLVLKLIQGLNHSKDGIARVTIIVLVNRNKSLKRKKGCIISVFYIYKLRNIQWERGKGGKKKSE